MRFYSAPARVRGSPADPVRRRCLALLPALLGGSLFAGCAGADTANGVPDQVLSARKLDELVARAFPYTHRLSGLASLTLRNPRLRLLPERNRLGTALDLLLVERLTGSRLGGGMDLDYGLRYDGREGAVRMTDVRVNRLAVDALPQPYQDLLSRYAPPLAEQLLDDFALYRFPRDQLALVRSMGLTVRALHVEPDGLHIALAPEPL